MRRDMILIREILLYIERQEREGGNRFITDFPIEGFSKTDVEYNLELLVKEGIVGGTGQIVGARYRAIVHGLTWSGHDFLDSTRNKSVWDKVQDEATKAGHSAASLTLGVLKELGLSIIRKDLSILG